MELVRLDYEHPRVVHEIREFGDVHETHDALQVHFRVNFRVRASEF